MCKNQVVHISHVVPHVSHHWEDCGCIVSTKNLSCGTTTVVVTNTTSVAIKTMTKLVAKARVLFADTILLVDILELWDLRI